MLFNNTRPPLGNAVAASHGGWVSDPPRSPGLPRAEKSIAGSKNGCVRTGSPCSLPTCWSPIKRASMCNGRSIKSKIDVRLLLAGSRCPAWRLVAVFRWSPHQPAPLFRQLSQKLLASRRGVLAILPAEAVLVSQLDIKGASISCKERECVRTATKQGPDSHMLTFEQAWH
jgi:hypothetical protein